MNQDFTPRSHSLLLTKYFSTVFNYSTKNSLLRLLTLIIFLSLSIPGWSQRTPAQANASAKEPSAIKVEQVSDRNTFIRMEDNAVLQLRLTNTTRETLDKVTVSVVFGWAALKPEVEYAENTKQVSVDRLAPGESKEIPVSLNTHLRPDDYKVVIKYSTPGKNSLITAGEFPVKIVARKLPEQFPVLMWGGGFNSIEQMKKVGFTHSLGVSSDDMKIWDAGKPVPPGSEERIHQTRRQLDKALADGFTLATNIYPGRSLDRAKELNEKYIRVDREGKINTRGGIDPLFPEVQKFVYNVGVSMARAYGDMPAFQAGLLHSEIRDHAQPSFHEVDKAAYRKATGREIPNEAVTNTGVDYRNLSSFPNDRVIADDDPLYTYYRWYWKEGDGWNGLNTQLANGLRTMNRPDFWNWHDPAVRTPSVYGSGGDIEVIAQWTYVYPDPIKIGLVADELLAMAAGSGRKQDVMNMTQIIWYRSQTAPIRKEGTKVPDFVAPWEKELPNAEFITIPPMHLREAFWTEIARPIKGIMYHGLPSLMKDQNHDSYRYTNPETQFELQRLVKNVIEPLGPTLRTIPSGVKSDIAFYEDFASQVYAKRGTRGWGGTWLGDAYHVMMWAGFQPEIIYDETIISKGLDNYKILVMADCDVLTKSVAEKIKAFQKRGGIIIADERLAPALKGDIMLKAYDRTGMAQKDKAELQARAGQMRQALAKRYTKYLDSSNPEVVPYRRRFGETDYIFLVNDYREPGQYVGHFERVMENGLPSVSRVSVRRNSGFAYDLVAHQQINLRQEKGQMVTDVNLGPCEGKMIMVTPKAIDHVSISVPDKLVRGDHNSFNIEIADNKGKAVDAVIPLEVQIQDAEGRLAENSGFWSAVNGKLDINLDIAPNDAEGIWQITVKDLASGKSSYVNFRVGKQPENKNIELDKDAGNAIQPKG